MTRNHTGAGAETQGESGIYSPPDGAQGQSARFVTAGNGRTRRESFNKIIIKRGGLFIFFEKPHQIAALFYLRERTRIKRIRRRQRDEQI
ncbi:hypothetical protein [Serratia rubidaea]|uniref:hypothetical protein n=1 Tax=Serratia rubidaea TaxID=61652 RepID=UPI002349CCDB|nr:hypothetical protein [Serratia rubidaea]MDC6112698.1 hypothetical protein [Serratia rubidaea]